MSYFSERYEAVHRDFCCVGVRVDLEEVERRPAPLLSALPPDEVSCVRRLRGPARLRFLAGRSLLRAELGDRLNLPPDDVPIVIDTWGKPRLGGCRLHFNLSHSGPYLFLALSPDRPVGADVETTPFCPTAVVRRFHQREQEGLTRLASDARPGAFRRLWAAKEACVKCLGAGGSVSAVEVSLGERGRWRDIAWHRVPVFPDAASVVAAAHG